MPVHSRIIKSIKELASSPIRSFLRHARSVRLQGLRDKHLGDCLDRLTINAEKIVSSKMQKSEKLDALQKAFADAHINGPRRKEFRWMSVEIIAEAMVSIRCFKQAILLANRHIYEPQIRNDLIWQLIDKMLEKGLSRDQVVYICKDLAGHVPGMYGFIDSIYNNYPLVD